jgi:hypothetical protein
LIAALTFFVCDLPAKDRWPPIDQTELADTKPKVDPEAGAEILLRDVYLDHGSFEEYDDHYYIRAKIYTQKGAEALATVEVPYKKWGRVTDIVVRTTKPDGTCVEMNPRDVYDRELVKEGHFQERVKAFAVPGLEPGVIVEIRYTVIDRDPDETSVFLMIQSKLPARVVKIKLQMPCDAGGPGLTLRCFSLRCPNQQVNPDANECYHFELHDVAGADEEPYSPAEIDTSPCIMVYYSYEETLPPNEYWPKLGIKLQEKLEKKSEIDDDIRTMLAKIVDRGDPADIKIRKIYDFCRTKIVNRNHSAEAKTTQARAHANKRYNETATDTLRNLSGDGYDVNMLFAALARAAGMNVRLAACNNRAQILFRKSLAEPFMFPYTAIAIRGDEDWLYYDPGSLYLPAGMLPWWITDTSVLISDSAGKAVPIKIAGSPADQSENTRKAMLRLDNEGAIEGEVSEIYTGQCEADLKTKFEEHTPSEIQELVKESIKKYQKNAELSDIKVENASSPTEPLKIAYKLRVPDYADRTGGRIFFQPAVFQKGVPPLFNAASRKTDIFFDFRETTTDDITIIPPEGYVLEEGNAPGGLDLSGLGNYQASLKVSRKTGRIFYHRVFRQTAALFPVESYPSIKKAFEAIQNLDNHTLILRRKDAETANASNSASPAPAAPIKQETGT